MGFLEMLANIQYRALTTLFPGSSGRSGASAYANKSKLAVLLGTDFFAKIAGKTVIDFGCGEGADSVEMARRGAGKVIGIDIREDVLRTGNERALAAGVREVCEFATSTKELADFVVSVDAFEHFADPAEALRIMAGVMKPGGEALVSFGPTWYHPWGGHLFSVFPWSHILLSERALIRWRATFKTDGATRFGEVAGGLNQMTIARFEKLVAESPLRCESIEAVPIRRLRYVHNRLTREFTTAVVRGRLVKRVGT